MDSDDDDDDDDDEDSDEDEDEYVLFSHLRAQKHRIHCIYLNI